MDPARVGEIDAIYLLPSACGKGVGRRLMGAALTRLGEARFHQVTLWVLDSNVRARRFYEAGGWLADGARKIEESRGFPHSSGAVQEAIGAIWDETRSILLMPRALVLVW